MKKIKWLVAFLILSLVIGVIGCKDLEVEHQHQFTKKWEIDEYYHWKKCNCGEIDFESEHSFGDWQVIKAATEEAEGKQERKCTVCPYTATEVIEKLAHTHKFAEEWTKDETNHWYASTCGHTTEVSGKAAHSFGDWKVTQEPTEEAEGSREKSCTVCEYTVPEVIEKLEHKHKFASEWTKDETNHWHAATCEHTTEVSGKAAHSFGDWTVTKEATEEAEGSRERSCTVCGYKATEVIAKLEHKHTYSEEWTKDANYHWHAATCGHTTEVSDKAEHTFGDWTTTKEATEEAEGSRERSCTVCEYTVPEVIEKLAHTHKFASEWTSDETNHWHAATCGHDVTDSKAEHSFNWQITKEASCTEKGEKKATCTTCGYEKTEITEKSEHTFGIWEVVTPPTTTEEGTSKRKCSICNFEETKSIIAIPENFVLIPAGTFQMGSTAGETNEKPVHEVTITKDFYMGKYEVTQAEYEKYCSYGSSSPSSTYGDGDNYPAYFVSWYDALVYCNKRSIAEGLTPCYSISGNTDPSKWGTVPTSSDSTWNAAVCDWNANGYRLPTEAEWEYAARAGDNTVSSLTWAGTNSSSNLGEYAWYYDNSSDKTHPVGTKKSNAFGLYDMSGNVLEWCWNWRTSCYDTETEGGTNPTGASSGDFRVFRGGGWFFYSVSCTVSDRSLNFPTFRDLYLGFRVVRASSN